LGVKRMLRLNRLIAFVMALVLGLAACSLTGCDLNDAEHDLTSNPEAGGSSAVPSSGLPPSKTSPSTPVSDAGELVEVTDLDDTFVIELRYATEDNFTGCRIYSQSRCFLVRGTAEKLIAANREFAEMGYRLKIWDAYRPSSAQRTLWELVPDPAFVANPERGSIHSRGAAVDVTLVDDDGNELPMPTGFDDFSEKAAIDYDGCTEDEAKNRDLLAEVMVRNGFVQIQSEWWHFADSQANSYPMLNVEFEDIE
jgi:D-alanyl-D-alanine dipeptidase